MYINNYERFCVEMAQIRLTAIIPQPLNRLAMLKQLQDGMQKLGEDIRDDFERTVKTWHDKPDFEPAHNKVLLVGANMMKVESVTEDLTYKYVVDGTRPHIIRPRIAKQLRYPGTFSPKTVPGLIDSGPGFSGPPGQRRMEVHHPGVEARHFDRAIRDKQKANAKQIMSSAILLAAASSRHAYP